MKINEERLLNTIIKIGEIGKINNSGISRIAFSEEYFIALKELKILMEERNLKVRIDDVGNIFGRRSGKDESLPVIMLGSHLDTVKNGGLFDGNLGIMAALECIALLNDNNILTDHPIEVVGFNAEEGSELGGTFGSRTAIGLQKLNLPQINEKLFTYNLTCENILNSKLKYNIHSFLELHIEQGIKLYNDKISIGLVYGIVGITRYKVTVLGESNHAGTTPMSFRKDALVSASALITNIFDIAKQMGDPLVATVGKLEVFPNSVNVIPGKVEFILEIRELSKDRINEYLEKIKFITSQNINSTIQFELYSDKDSILLNDEIISIVEKVCNAKNFSYNKMVSGAGHDAMEFAKKIPTGLIFIPSKDGISHNKEEYSFDNDIITGTEVLLDSILCIDNETTFNCDKLNSSDYDLNI